jgi:YodL-like
MSTHVEIFLADPMVTAVTLPPFDRQQMRYVYWFELAYCSSDQELLDESFRILNVDHPAGYNERSLSVGDVVTIGRRRSYRCDWLGWERLNRPLLRRRGPRDLAQWLEARKQELWPRIGRCICQLRGCAAAHAPACARCRSFIYDPDFIPPRRWPNKLADRARIFKRKCLHRCEVCRRCIWFSQEPCCSESCFEQWFPF